MTKRAISMQYVNCSYPNAPGPVLAASETCQRLACSGVVTPNGNLMWRCPEHEGKIDAETTGPVRWMVETK